MGSARTEIVQAITFDLDAPQEVSKKLDAAEQAVKQWLQSCSKEEVQKLMELNK
ncbi:hypothetical protein [Alicyclobacillus macrosporangiidus]|uniref:hypothetical protein n=1 Tax=Alicyclobacillus macrosporangiidus TaxID=392015 RepID=UPI000A4CBA12|nr:hypothetical protein [Alicyclobacillus macrosporangiidus]